MAKPYDKTGHGVGGGAEGQSAVKDSQAAGSDQAVKPDGSAGSTRVDAAQASEADSDWDFSSGSAGMAKETKIGLALCVLLIGAFAFVVYSKMNKQNRLDEGFVAGTNTDTSSDDAPPPEDDAQHDDFGGEPAHGHDHDNAFANDRQNTAEDFDVPPRKRNDFQQIAALKQEHQRQHGADPWQTQQAGSVDDWSQGRQSARQDDPFTQASRSHTHHGDQQHRNATDEPGFGFEDSNPNESQTAQQSEKKSWNVTDFLGSQQRDTTKQQQPLRAEADEEPFGLEPVEHVELAQAETHRQPGDEFNPFAEADQSSNSQGERIQQSAATDWGSTTRVQQSGDATGYYSDDEFGDLGPAPEPGQSQQDDPFGLQDTHEDHAHDDFSQPFGDGNDQPYGQHDHGTRDHLLPRTAEAPITVGSDRPTVYVVQQGDNFWAISKQQYGAGRYYKALASYNQRRIPDPRRLRPGMKVLVPQTQTLEARFPSLCPWRTAKPVGGTVGSDNSPGYFTNVDGTPLYRIGAEDTLTAIAKNHLGRASRWVQVFALNRDSISDPAKLKIGTVLQLPADASRVQLVRRSRDFR